ncbi:MAG: NTE family protein rssA [Beijerinckiaceae bacterium]|nr:MAG: NTE family protein rssA [Beijerinckiaceae bacterium]
MFSPKIPELAASIIRKNARDALDAATPDKPKKRRLRIGVALGAGAARGWSHIGILQEFAAHDIVPDIVAGTSIGAVVGGCYAAGRLDLLSDFALSLTKRRVFGLMDLSLSGGGLVAGHKLKKALDEALGSLHIEDLPKRFAAVTTEIKTGHEVWLRRGNLVEAIRASYAIPGIFEPVQIDGRWFFDGALVNPVPVTICRALGADRVIAVNVMSDHASRGTIIDDSLGREGAFDWDRQQTAKDEGSSSSAPNIATIMLDAFNIAQDRISRSRLAGDPPDVLINARNSHVGLFDFHRAEELIEIGRDAARRSLDDLSEYRDLSARTATDTVQSAA